MTLRLGALAVLLIVVGVVQALQTDDPRQIATQSFDYVIIG